MKDAVDSFLNHLVVEKGFSRNTLEAYRNDLNQFMEFAQGRPHDYRDGEMPSDSRTLEAGWPRLREWGQVDLSLLTEYVSNLRAKKSYRDTTTARKVAALKSFFNFLVQEEAVEQDPTEFLSSPRVGRSLPKFLSEEEVERLLDQPAREESPEGRRDYAILELLYATGLRVTEMVSLNLHDVNLQEGYIRCMGKGSKERIVYVYPRAVQSVRAYVDEARPHLLSSSRSLSGRDGTADRGPGSSGPAGSASDGRRAGGTEERALFLNQRGGRLTRQWVWTILKAYARKASLEKSITPHVLRHSFATHMLRGGASLRHLQELLGHSSITTTQVYTHLTKDHVRKEYERSHPRS